MSKLYEIKQTQEELKTLIDNYEDKTNEIKTKCEHLVEEHYKQITDYVLKEYEPFRYFFKENACGWFHNKRITKGQIQSGFAVPDNFNVVADVLHCGRYGTIYVGVNEDENRVEFLECIGGSTHVFDSHEYIINHWQDIKPHILPSLWTIRDNFLKVEARARKEAKTRLANLKTFKL